jgi:hypothetical protein
MNWICRQVFQKTMMRGKMTMRISINMMTKVKAAEVAVPQVAAAIGIEQTSG